MNNNKVMVITAVVLALAIGGLVYITKPSIDVVTPSPTNSPSQPTDQIITQPASTTSSTLKISPVPTKVMVPKQNQPAMQIDKTKSYTATITTDKGAITVSLYADKTPVTVNNFVSLAKKGFYNNVIFHRIIKGFMIQGGDPTGTGSGGPGYVFDDEVFDGDYTRGTLAMANAGPNTNGSQFFIMHKDTPLPKNYVIFGKVTKGMEVVDAIAEAPVKAGASGEQSTPVTPVKIVKVEILEK